MRINRHINGTREVSIDIVFYGRAIAATEALVFKDLVFFGDEKVEVTEEGFNVFTLHPPRRILRFHCCRLSALELDDAIPYRQESKSLEARKRGTAYKEILIGKEKRILDGIEDNAV